MNKKSKILTIILLLIPFFVAVGFSTWVIIYEVVFSPTYVQGNKISEAFGYAQEVYYDGSVKYPTIKEGVELDATLTYKYKTKDGSEFDGCPTESGVYDIIVTAIGNDSGECQVKFTIKKMQLILTKTQLEIDYKDNNLTYNDFCTKVSEQIVITNQDNVVQDIEHRNGYTIPYIHNGIYYYGEYNSKTLIDNTSTEYVFGSTYTSKIELDESLLKNYEFVNSPVFTIKYKTAKIGDKFYTIEDALSSNSGNIQLLGNSSGGLTYITTSFSKLTKAEGNPYNTNSYTLSGRNLIVPYDESGNDHDKGEKDKGNVYSALIISDNITLNLLNNANLIAAAYIGYKQPNTTISCERGVIINNGIINVNNGCNISAYGYIKGNGLINLLNGSTAIDCMSTYDWPGGTAGGSMYQDVLPTNAWSLHNISCVTNIYSGSQYKAYFMVSMSIVNEVDATPIIIGKSADTDCVFKISSGYFRKSVKKAASWTNEDKKYTDLFSITGSNQISGQRDVMELFGDCQDGKFQMTVKTFLSSIKMQTSTSIPLPISFMDIYIHSNSNMTISNSDYLFLPGSNLIIDTNATVTVGDNVDISISKWNEFSDYTAETYSFAAKCVDKQDAKFILNGTLNINGNIGGTISTEKNGAILNLSNGSTNSTYRSMKSTTSGNYYLSNTINATGNINNVESSSFNNISYVSSSQSGIFTWMPATDITTFTMRFYDNDKTTLLEEMNVQVINDTTYTVVGNEFKPTKRFYTFDKWTDINGNEIIGKTFEDNTQTINLYAKWNIKEYTLFYTLEYNEENVMDSVSLENKLETLSINDFVDEQININTSVSYLGKNFNGWYLGYDSTGVKTNTITIAILNRFFDEYGDDTSTIPLYGYFSDSKNYTISFVDNKHNNEDFEDITDISDDLDLKLPTIDKFSTNYDTDTSERYYFDGWYTASGNMLYFSGKTIKYYIENEYILESDIIDGKITLYAKFKEKSYVVKYYTDSELSQEIEDYRQYYNKDQSFILNASITKDDYDEDIDEDGKTDILHKYTFNGWVIGNEKQQPGYNYKGGNSNLVIYAEFDDNKYVKISFDCTEATISVVYNGNEQKCSNGTIEFPMNTVVTLTVNYAQSDDQVWKINEVPQDTTTVNKTLTNHLNIYAYSKNSCIISGTLITLADGSTKKIDDITYDDYILVFNHETGTYDVSKMLFITHEDDGYQEYETITLNFSNNYTITIVAEHGFYDMDLMKYIFIDKENVESFIGHKFYSTGYINGEFIASYIELLSYEIKNEVTRIFCPVTAYHMNSFNNGLLSMPNFPYGAQGLVNIFEYDDNLKFNEEKMQADIEKYGIFEYEYFKDYFSYEAYVASPAIYLKVSIGKGYLTHEQMMLVIEYLLTGDLIV